MAKSYPNSNSSLPHTLKAIVRMSIDTLGQSIKEIYGAESYRFIEKLRKDMVGLRDESPEKAYLKLKSYRKKFKHLSDSKLSEINHSFSLYMELINRCERAYRSFRLSTKETVVANKNNPYALIFVFTAHPTEARSKAFLKVMSEIELLLIERLQSSHSNIQESLKYLISLALKLNLSEQEKPQVKEEAENIFQVTLSSKIIAKQIELLNKGINIQYRTWVGGDKDGHPFVDDRTMVQSWTASRKYLLNYANSQIQITLDHFCEIQSKDIKLIVKELRIFKTDLDKLQKVSKNDGSKIKRIRLKLESINKKVSQSLKINQPNLRNLSSLFWLYPALVMPLEIREDSELVHKALSNKSQAISKMLRTLKETSGGILTKWYVRGFVLSMAERVEDIEAGIKLTKKELGNHNIPVIPLFETQFALENSKRILEELFKSSPEVKKIHQKKWGARFEIMLGYSDSSKESGVFTSRLLIGETLNKISPFLKGENLTPVFFHGSGGSIERGGGSIKEQTAYWPKEALNIYKSTIQGEMVPRNFGNPLILESSIGKIVENYRGHKQEKAQISYNKNKLLRKFSEKITEKYQAFIKADDFPAFLTAATPYAYLDQLKIGSRPTKRNTGSSEIKLRAIPWVLCWTQTRILFPTWWGVGSTWFEMTDKEKFHFIQLYHDSKFLKTYINILGFSLSKIELPIFKIYLEENLNPKSAESYYQKFDKEFNLTKQFFREVTGEEQLLWFRPWLSESIRMRSTMIHPINLTQIESLRRKNSLLLRESVTGISCGMLTTG